MNSFIYIYAFIYYIIIPILFCRIAFNGKKFCSVWLFCVFYIPFIYEIFHNTIYCALYRAYGYFSILPPSLAGVLIENKFKKIEGKKHIFVIILSWIIPGLIAAFAFTEIKRYCPGL